LQKYHVAQKNSMYTTCILTLSKWSRHHKLLLYYSCFLRNDQYIVYPVPSLAEELPGSVLLTLTSSALITSSLPLLDKTIESLFIDNNNLPPPTRTHVSSSTSNGAQLQKAEPRQALGLTIATLALQIDCSSSAWTCSRAMTSLDCGCYIERTIHAQIFW